MNEIELNAENAENIVKIELEDGTENTIYIKQVEEGEDYYIILKGNQTLFKISKVKKEEIIKTNDSDKPEESEVVI